MTSPRPHRAARRLACLLAALLATGVLAQSDEEKARADLKALQRDIARINQEISTASSRRNTLQGQLREAEVALGQLEKDLAANRERVADKRKELVALEAEREQLEQARDEQQARIAVELRTAWQLGRQGQVKVLLNQESPHTVARTMAYYRYFFEARNDLLEQYRGTLRELDAVEQRIAAAIEQLHQRERDIEQQQENVARAQRNREQAVANLTASIRDKGEALLVLEADRKELEKLLKAIEEAVVNLQVPQDYQAFKAAKGKMPWPVPGRASHRFGNSRNEGKMRWQGVLIPATEGTQVKAIHHGRVVYADWLRGMGLLIIVDHGDGYMSLYAHNQSLLKDVGEWVTADTPVSTVGSSGGQDRPALYFEVRQDGKPVNPASWCRK